MDYDIQRNIEENGKPPDGGEPIMLSIQHILGALFLLLFGNIFASVCFVIELFWYHTVQNFGLTKKVAEKWKNYKRH